MTEQQPTTTEPDIALDWPEPNSHDVLRAAVADTLGLDVEDVQPYRTD